MCVALLGAQSSCWKGRYVVYRFSAPSCTVAAFALPDSLVEPPYRYTVMQGTEPMCRGSKVYRSAGGDLAVRLSRGSSCSLDIGYRLLVPPQPASDEKLQQFEVEQRRSAETLARLIMKGTGGQPTLAKVERLESSEDLRTWCARTSSSATQPCTRRLAISTGAAP